MAIVGSAGGEEAPAAKPASQPARQPAKEITLDLGNNVTMKLALIPAGKFTMGSAEEEQGRKYDESPQHKVAISKSFYMGLYPVTRKQFAAFVADSKFQTDAEKDGWANTYDGKEWVHIDGASWKNPFFKEAGELSGMIFGDSDSPKKTGVQQTDEHPVICINYNDAVEFCKWLSNKTNNIVMLPTEAQWEHACRGESTTRFNFGDDIGYKKLKNHAWFRDNSDAGTHPAGKKEPNDWGLYDMHGQVWEWCGDFYTESYSGSNETDPMGPETGPGRVLRGGSWFDINQTCRSAARIWLPPEIRTFATGFRVVMAMPLDLNLLAEVSRLVAQLDSDDFNTRDAAHKKLKSMGTAILPALRKISDSGKCSAEAEARIRQIIESYSRSIDGEVVRE